MNQNKAVPTWGNIGKRFLLIIVGFAMATLMHVLAMIKGWGVEPLSWPWIIGAGVFGMAFVRLFVEEILNHGNGKE